MLYTTLEKIRANHPCVTGWQKLLQSLGKTGADDEPLSFVDILGSNGLDDALWATRSAPEYNREWRLFAAWCARSCQPADADPRSIAAIDYAERYANGEADVQELDAAWNAAVAAAAAVEAAAAWAPAVASAVAWAAGEAAWAAVAAARSEAAPDEATVPGEAAAAAQAVAAWTAGEAGETAAAQEAEFRRVVG